MQNHYPLTGEDVVAQKTPCSFDVRCGSFLAVYRRGKPAMAEPERTATRSRRSRFFAEYGVTTTDFVPSMLAAFVALRRPDTARQSCATSNRFSVVVRRRLIMPRMATVNWRAVHNRYGPTEWR
ncbi:AMP-binding protein [Shigella flexneri]